MEKRLQVFDYLRVTAAFAVIAIHVTSKYAPVNITGFVLNQVVRFAVPMFIILSGFLLYYTSRRRKGKPYMASLGKRVRKVFIPYLLWTLIYMLYTVRHTIEKAFTTDFLKIYLKNIALGRGTVHLYFILIIIQLYIIYELFDMFIRSRHDGLWLAAAFAITAYLQLGIYLYRWNIHIIPQIPLNYYILFPTWMFYFVLGMYFAKHEGSWKEKLVQKTVPLGIVWFISLLVLILDSRYTNTYGSSMKPSVMLYSITSFFFYYSAFSRIRTGNRHFPAAITWISSQAFFIYLIHVLLMEYLKSFAYIMKLGPIWSGTSGMLLYYFAVAAASLLFAYLASLLPFIGILGGVPRTRRLPTGELS